MNDRATAGPVALIDYGAGNLASVRKALRRLGAQVLTPATPVDLVGAQAIIVPGVGHFDATAALTPPWHDAIRRATEQGTALLGICLGLQWLFEGSDEAPGVAGLGALAGRCTRFASTPQPDGAPLKVPHLGWNVVSRIRSSLLLEDLPANAYAYFAHSYHAPDTPDTVAVTTYGVAFPAVVERPPVFGAQCHPELSDAFGLGLLDNFLRRAPGAARRAAAVGTGRGVE